MEREYVESSMITSIGHENSILEIEFKSNGQVWQYFDVPEYVYHEMMAADSKGKYFHKNIKGKYMESRV
jgi:hypothetical protein